jgi:hypothetical protein
MRRGLAPQCWRAAATSRRLPVSADRRDDATANLWSWRHHPPAGHSMA